MNRTLKTFNLFQLKERGYGNIDALDGSKGMLEKAAEKGIYKNYIHALVGPQPVEGVEQGIDVFHYIQLKFSMFRNAITLADLGGRGRHMPPYGTQFFHFRIHFHQKVPTSEVHAPPLTGARPLREILDPPLNYLNKLQNNYFLDTYDVLICVGALHTSHVRYESFESLAAITKPGKISGSHLFCGPLDQTNDIFPFGPVADPSVYFTIENGPFGQTDHRTSMTRD